MNEKSQILLLEALYVLDVVTCRSFFISGLQKIDGIFPEAFCFFLSKDRCVTKDTYRIG
jgi:hypothetical protein